MDKTQFTVDKIWVEFSERQWEQHKLEMFIKFNQLELDLIYSVSLYVQNKCRLQVCMIFLSQTKASHFCNLRWMNQTSDDISFPLKKIISFNIRILQNKLAVLNEKLRTFFEKQIGNYNISIQAKNKIKKFKEQ